MQKPQPRTTRLICNPLKQVIDERVQNRHTLVRNARIRMDLLQHYTIEQRPVSSCPTRLNTNVKSYPCICSCYTFPFSPFSSSFALLLGRHPWRLHRAAVLQKQEQQTQGPWPPWMQVLWMPWKDVQSVPGACQWLEAQSRTSITFATAI